MKLKFILFALYFFTMVGYAQQIEVTKGPIIDPKQILADVEIPNTSLFKRSNYSSTLFFNPNKKLTYTGVGFSDDAFQFAVLEDYLKYSGVKKLTSESIDEKVALNSFFIINDKMYVMYSQKFPKQDEFSVYVNEVSPEMVVLGSPIIIHNFKELKKYGMNISVESSEDKRHILITREHDTKPREKQKLECKVINQSFAEVWFKKIETENLDKELRLRSMKLDNSGNMYLLVEHKEGKQYQPMLYTYFWKSKSLKPAKLGLTEGENFGTKMELLNGEKPFIVGLNKNKKIMSYFINRLNVQTQNIEKLGSNAMPDDFYKASKFRAMDTYDWSVSDMITLSNNSIVASIEAILVDSKYHFHHSYNAYIVSFMEDGTSNWSKTIQKKQSTIPGLAGHMLVPKDDAVLVIYNDNEENISKRPEDAKIEGFTNKDAMAVVQEIDATGSVNKYPFFTDNELEDSALYLLMTKKIKTDLYYSACINIKNRFSIESRNFTFRIK